jgi:DNA polymerase I-like protein with 3'-5' exonuclease and polymerase domains
MALITLAGMLRRRRMKSRVVMILHDAIGVEAPREEADQTKSLLQRSMVGEVEFPFVPLEVAFQWLHATLRVVF